MTESNITFVLFAYNEERRIPYVLRNLQPYGRILVVDNMSTDRTVEISKSFGAEIFSRKNDSGWTEGEEEVARVLSRVNTEWVYWGYVDELCPKALLKKFVEIAKEDKYKIIYAQRINLNYGLLGLSLDYPYSTRVFKKGSIDFKGNKIHSFGMVVCSPDEILNLPKTDEYSVYHFSTYNVSKFELAHSRYSDVEAQQKIENGKHFSLMRLLVFPVAVFFKYYFLGGGWRFGVPGFIMSMQYYFFRFNVAAKMWEKENKVTLESIEGRYDELKENLIAGDIRKKAK
jgi:glycosyltransferase involved in cell wall biosynthesis